MAISHFKPLILPSFFVASILCYFAIITCASRISIKELTFPTLPTELPDPDLPLLPKLPQPEPYNLPQQHPKLQLPPIPYIPPLGRFHAYLPKMPELPSLPQLPSLPGLPELPGLPRPSFFPPIPGLPQQLTKAESEP